jgi:hypothetical protein
MMSAQLAAIAEAEELATSQQVYPLHTSGPFLTRQPGRPPRSDQIWSAMDVAADPGRAERRCWPCPRLGGLIHS